MTASKASQVITWADPAPITYGSTLAGVLNASVTTGDGALTYDRQATDVLGAGPQTITATAAATTNYNLATKSVTLTVNRATPTVTATGGSFEYDGATHGATATATGVDGVSLSAPTITYNGGSALPKDAGSYAVVASLAGTANYESGSATATVTISRRALSVTADNQTRVYGDANPTLTGTLTGAVSGDNLSGSYSTAATASSAVGNYPVVAAVTDPGSRLGNYTVTSTAGTLTITAAPLTVTPANASRVYGAANPSFTGALTGIRNSDPITASYATLATAASAVGSYDITASLADPSTRLGNYTVTLNKGALTVTPAPLTVTANSATKIQGDIVPPLTGSITGLQNGDGITATYSTAATDMSVPGAYPITATLTDASPAKLGNYTVTYQSGTLTVTVNAPPVLGAITAPTAPVQLGGSITASATFTDVDPSASRNYPVSIDWGDGTASYTNQLANPGSISSAHTYAAAGVYTVAISVADKVNTAPVSQIFQYVVVYDPNGGFVTGGGWINSPAGAYVRDPSLSGKATFGFVSKYQKGANAPTGNTQFQFREGSFDFKSTTYQWLVISGSRAQFKGTGTVNGAGDYGFLLTATDGQPDQFRIKITDRVTGQLVYDNMMGASDTDPLAGASTILGGGSIQIQSR